MRYQPADDRYERMIYRRCGASGAAAAGGLARALAQFRRATPPHEIKRAICRTAFDHGITHFDLANNYGPPPGRAETAFGEILRTDFAGLPRRADHLDQGRLRHVARPLRRVGQPQVPDRLLRPVAEADGARLCRHLLFAPLRPRHAARGNHGRARSPSCARARALYVGISSYNSAATREAAAILKDLGTPCLIHQPSYNMLNRWVERDGLKETLAGARHRLDRLHAAGAGHADRRNTSTASRRAAAPPRARACAPRFLTDRAIAAHPRAERASPRRAARPWRRWRSPGSCATAASPPR